MQPLDIIHKYYKKGTKLYDIYISHVSDVTAKALLVAQKHPELAIDVKFLEEAAMLHDIGIFKTKSPAIACEGSYPYICHGYLGRGTAHIGGASQARTGVRTAYRNR